MKKFITLSLFVLATPALAGGPQPFRPGTTSVEVLKQLKSEKMLRASGVVGQINSILNHSAVRNLRLRTEALECSAILLYKVAVRALSGSNPSTPFGLEVAGAARSDYERLGGPEKDWCDNKGGGAGADSIWKAMKANNLAVVVPEPDSPSYVPPPPNDDDVAFKAFLALGYSLGVLVEGYQKASAAVASSTFVFTFDPRLFHNPTRRVDPRQMQ